MSDLVIVLIIVAVVVTLWVVLTVSNFAINKVTRTGDSSVEARRRKLGLDKD
jgi:hypothetical protein